MAHEGGSGSQNQRHGQCPGPELIALMKTHCAHNKLSTVQAQESNPLGWEDAGGHGLKPSHANPVAASLEDLARPEPKTLEKLWI